MHRATLVPALAVALSVALSSSVVLAAPLAPEPDKGFVTEVHKSKAGQIVFAKTLQAITTPEKSAEFTDTFKGEESIFFRAYLPSSLNNAFRAQGTSCVGGERLWSITVDGKPVKDDNSPYFYGEVLDKNGFTQSTSVRFDKALNATPDSDKAIWNNYNDKVASKLTPGEHTITLALRGLCKHMTTHENIVYLDKDLATGTFTVNVTKALTVDVMPKPARKDEKLAKEAADILQREWASDKILKVVFVEPDWTKRYEERFGRQVLLRRTIAAAVAVKQATKCRVFNVTFGQEANGPNFGPTARYSNGGNKEVDCSALK